MVVAGGLNIWSPIYSVPNWFTFPAILSGLLAGLLVTVLKLPTHDGGIWSSLQTTMTGMLALLIFYAVGLVGAGSVKMNMVFGAWVGCAVAVVPASTIIVVSALIGVAMSWVLGLVKRRLYPAPPDTDDPRWYLIPAQVTLSLGAIGGMVLCVLLRWA